jgi:hypothetical protein
VAKESPEMEREIISKGIESKPLEPFYNFKDTPRGTVLDGRYIGKFESKARAGSFFHVFEREDGTRFAAWDNTALGYRVQELQDKEKELGLEAGTLYMSVTFLGKPAGKKSYSFGKPTIYRIGGTGAVSQNAQAVSNQVTTEEIPF